MSGSMYARWKSDDTSRTIHGYNQKTSSQTFLIIVCEQKSNTHSFQVLEICAKKHMPYDWEDNEVSTTSCMFSCKHLCHYRIVNVCRDKQQTNSHFSGGVIVIVWAVNSSSKYLVSVSDDTWGLKGGISWGRKRGGWKTQNTCLCRSDTAYSMASWRAQSNASDLRLHCAICEGCSSDSDLLVHRVAHNLCLNMYH